MASKSKFSDQKKGSNTAAQPPQWTEYLCCSVCQKDFNRTDRCPISLGCGHTLCRSCLEKLEQPLCHFDQTPIKCNKFDLPINSALLQLLPGDSEKTSSQHVHVSQTASCDSNSINQYVKNYENARICIDELALYLKPGKASDLSRPMQRKLVALINCQLLEDEGQKRVLRACRALGERTATELILLHQNPTTLSACLWAAVRARGCQFLGPAMQEEALKLIHLALEDGSELSRKVLVQIVVKNLQTQFSQASKTSIGHVVQLLYRASCFKVTKRDNDSSLMRLKDEFLIYEELRKEHDSQIVQIAREAGLRIAPDQWSALLYGDQAHKSHMQSIIDRLQSGGSFQQCIADLSLALQRFNDPGHIHKLLPHFKFLSEMDTENPSWDCLEKSTYFAKLCVRELVEFTNHHHHWLWQCQDATQQTSKYKTSMCRDSKNKGICPRGQSCTFAHSETELQLYRNRRKKGGQIGLNQNEFKMENSKHCEKVHFNQAEKSNLQDSERLPPQTVGLPQQHICQCGNTINQNYGGNPKPSSYLQDQGNAQPYPSVHNPSTSHSLNVVSNSFQPNLVVNRNQSVPIAGHQQVGPILAPPTSMHQPSQIHYVARNQLVFESKTPAYEPVQIFSDNSSRYAQRIPLGAPEVQSHANNALPTAIVQPNHYVVHGQQNPGYYQLQTNQVQTILSDPPILTHHQNFSAPPPTYACLTLQNGQQVNVPTPNQSMVQQSPATFQQPPIQVHNVSPSQPINYGQSVVVPAGTPITSQPPVPSMISPQPFIPTRPLGANETFVTTPTVMPPVVVPSEDLSIIPNSVYTQCHVVVPSKVDNSASLAELRHRKDEVINKLVKKRIAAPKVEENLHYKVGSYCDIPVESSSCDKTLKHDMVSVSISYNSFMTPSVSASTVQTHVQNPNKHFQKSSNGHYSLWSGATCIPNLNKMPLNEEYLQNIPGIDVVSDLDTSTTQVSAFQDDNSYLGKYVNSQFSNTSDVRLDYSPTSKHFHADDDIISIKDQRIVSKYGPIARTIRSKTTAAIPEQVTSNGKSKTHAFASDKNRKKSNFVAGEQDSWSQYMKCIRSDVEPTAETNKLPDVVRNNYAQASSQQNSAFAADMPAQMVITPDVNEDLLLAIELQQIEIGIQRIQRDSYMN